MRKLLNSFVCILLVLSIVVPVYALPNEDEVLSDVPYDYGVVPFSDEWYNLDVLDQKKIFSLTLEVAKSLTTEALLETILNNPFIVDLLTYEDFNSAIRSRDSEFQILEFLSRLDVDNILIKYINLYSNSLSEYQNRQNFRFSNNFSFNLFSEKDKQIVYNVIKFEFLNKLLRNNLDIKNQTLKVYRAIKSFVYTKGWQEVTCYLNCTFEDNGSSEIESDATTILYYSIYSPQGVQVVRGKDSTFNCHSYAWHSADYLANNVWIKYADLYLKEATRVYGSNIQIGTRVCYFNSNGDCVHSGLVNELNSDGTIKNVVSKWGFCQLMLHPLTVCPYTTNDIRYYNY